MRDDDLLTTGPRVPKLRVEYDYPPADKIDALCRLACNLGMDHDGPTADVLLRRLFRDYGLSAYRMVEAARATE